METRTIFQKIIATRRDRRIKFRWEIGCFFEWQIRKNEKSHKLSSLKLFYCLNWQIKCLKVVYIKRMYKTIKEMSNTNEQEVERNDFKVVIEEDILEQCLADEVMIDEAEDDIDNSDNEIIEQKQEVKGSKSKRQTYHNCQKHLVTILKKYINSKALESKKQTSQIQIQLWDLFRSSKKKTKDLISLTFGNGEIQSLQKKIIEYGFQKVYETFPKELIIQAKIALQYQILRQLKQMNLQKIVERTRVQNKTFFVSYIQDFIESIELNKFEERFMTLKKKSQLSQ